MCNDYLFSPHSFFTLFLIIMVPTHSEGGRDHRHTSPCLFLSTVLSVLTLFFGLMFRLVMSGPVSLSLSIFPALILGSVCSIWAKFSNGDNYRGRPGERRRWVLPVCPVSCMLLQASQLHLPAFPLSAFISVAVCHHRSSGPAINSDSPSSDCSLFFSPSFKNAKEKTQAVITEQSEAICYASVVRAAANEARR